MRFILLSLVICLSTITCYSQSVPVDPLTGRANITIPIWTLTEGNLTVPISVAYSGGGVRVTEGEGSAGMSWNLIAGGSVSRELRGLPDDYNVSGDTRKGWLVHDQTDEITGYNYSGTDCSSQTAQYNFIASYSDTYDKEPDVFRFNAPGLSGSFVFDYLRNVRLLNYQDLKIEVTRSGGTGPITQIKITNNLGVAYTFSSAVSTKRQAIRIDGTTGDPKLFRADWYMYQTALTFTTQWSLTSMTAPSGASISFSYGGSGPAIGVKKVITISSTTNKEKERYRIKDEIESYPSIAEINTNSIRASFDWDQNRISSIIIEDNQDHYEKQYAFVYGAIRDTRDDVDPLFRSFLKEVRLEENCSTLPSYQFNYTGVSWTTQTNSIPFETENLQDYWGYYNGVATNNVPTIYVYSAKSNAEKYRLSPISGQTPTSTLTGANRSVNPNVVMAATISSIKYPTGAVATIDFESNEFYDTEAASKRYGSGVRVKRVTVTGVGKGSANLQTDYEYKLANDTTSGKLSYRPVYVFGGSDSIYRTSENMAPDDGVLYTRTTIKQTGKGKTVYEFSNPGTYPESSASPDWTAASARKAAAVCGQNGLQETGYYTFPFAPNLNYDFEQGQLQKVTDYAEDGTKVRETAYTYSRLTTTAVTVKGLRFEFTGSPSVGVYSIYDILTNVGKVNVTETTTVAEEASPYTNMISTTSTYEYSTVHNLLKSKATANSDGVIYKVKYKYAKDFSSLTNPNSSYADAVAMKSLNDNFRHGEVVETISSRTDGGNELITGASLTLYKTFGTQVLPHVMKQFPAVTGFTETGITGSPQTLSVHSSYFTTATVQSYNAIGLPISIVDNKKKKSGTHFGYTDTTPVAFVTNAFAEETVYEGFESATTFGLGVSGASSNVAGWTGASGKSITSSVKFTRSNVQKGIGQYRFSCWVKSAGTPTISFKALNGVTVQSTGTAVYSGAGQWQYLEGVMNMSSVSSVFTLEVSTTATTEFDDIRFYPALATMVTSTEQRLAGPTSQSDDRGISAFTQYDELGRVRYQQDRQKNIVQVTDYRYRNEVALPLTSNYTNTGGTTIDQDEDLDFTAPTNCGVVTYSWVVDGTQVSTASNFTHAFSTTGYHTVELTVSSTAGSVSTTKSFCVIPFEGEIRLNSVNQSHFKCDASFSRTITINQIICGGIVASNPQIEWSYKRNSESSWTGLTGTTSVTFSLIGTGSPEGYQVKCRVTTGCTIRNTADDKCKGTHQVVIEEITAFSYTHTSDPCL